MIQKSSDVLVHLGLEQMDKMQLGAEIVASVCTSLACIVSSISIAMHLRYNNHPTIQKYTIRILLMVPVYAIEAWLGLHFTRYRVLFETLRAFYEAFVVLSFLQLLLAYMGGPVMLAKSFSTRDPVYHHFPCCCMRTWKMGPQFLQRTLVGTLQYVLVSIAITIVVVICSFLGVYHDGSFTDYKSAYLYCTIIQTFSQLWALYCLVLFYRASRSEMQAIRALPKFICIKIIVFFTWWQSMTIYLLEETKLIKVDMSSGGNGGSERCWWGCEQISTLSDASTEPAAVVTVARRLLRGPDVHIHLPQPQNQQPFGQWEGAIEQKLAKALLYAPTLLFGASSSAASAAQGFDQSHAVAPDSAQSGGRAPSQEAYERELGGKLECFIICVEMFLISLAHLYAFPHSEFERPHSKFKKAMEKQQSVTGRRRGKGSGAGAAGHSAPASKATKLDGNSGRSVSGMLASGVNLLDIITFIKDISDLNSTTSGNGGSSAASRNERGHGPGGWAGHKGNWSPFAGRRRGTLGAQSPAPFFPGAGSGASAAAGAAVEAEEQRPLVGGAGGTDGEVADYGTHAHNLAAERGDPTHVASAAGYGNAANVKFI